MNKESGLTEGTLLVKCNRCNILFTDKKTVSIESKYIEEYGVCSKCYCDNLERTKEEWGNIVSGTLRAHFKFLDDILKNKDNRVSDIKSVEDTDE